MEFTKSKIAVAVLAVTSSFAYANEQVAQLGVIDVVTENTGAKSKTNVVTLKDLNKGTKEDLRGVLSAEPSINFGGGTGGTSQWVTIRGMGQDQIDMKVDNTYSDSQMFHHQSRFMLDPSLIKRIDVRKGAGSASAGIGATSGSIEATTVDAKDLLREEQNFGFKLNAGVSSNKGHSQGATVYGKSGAFDAILSGNWETNESYKGGKGYANKAGSNTVKNSALGQRGLLAKFGVDINENHRITLSHRQERYHGERALREEFDFSQAGNDANNSPKYTVTKQDTTNLEYTGHNIGFITNLTANAYYMRYDKKRPDDFARGRWMNLGGRIITKGANINFDSEIGKNHLIKYGVNLRNQEGQPRSGATQEKTDTGVYVEGIWGFSPVTLTTGLRYDHFSYTAPNKSKASDGDFNPSVGLIWEVVKGLSLNSNLNFATRSPRLFETALSGSGVSRIDRNIKAEKARNVEVGFNYDLNDLFSFNGSYFWQRVKNAHAIEYDANDIGTLVNGALVRNQGYELGAAFKYSGFKFRLGVAESKPETYILKDTNLDSSVYAVAVGRTWTAGLSYKFENPSLEIGWKGRFVESETGTPSRGSSNSSNNVKQAGYGINDFYASWEANQNLTINFAVNNAFNKYYKSHSQRTGVNSLPGTGRDFRLNVAYTY